MWYDITRTLSYNALFNFVLGARGIGKTYGLKKYAIKKFLSSGKQFMYIRRYKTELKQNNTFFKAVSAEFPETKFDVKGNNYLINDKIAGFSMALSTAKISKSTDFSGVDLIIFDEFIIDVGAYHYLSDEVINFLEAYETIARLRDVKVFFLSNSITETNPYHLYFNLRMPDGKHICVKNDILLEYIDGAEYSNVKKQTRFGKIIDGTQYAQYSIDNVFLRDNNTFVEKRTEKATYYFTIKYNGDFFGVWIDYSYGKIFISDEYDQYCKLVYTLTLDDHSPNTLLTRSLSKCVLLKNLIENFKIGNVRFETINIKNITYGMFKLLIVR